MSCDVPLGLVFNMPQVYVLLYLMARITGKKPGKAYHKIINAHIYEDQVGQVKEQLQRTPYEAPKLLVHDAIKTLKDIETWVTPHHFMLEGYQHHEPISFPFSV